MSVMCRRAVESDSADLKTLWQLSFPDDTTQDIEAFFDTFPPAQHAYVLCEDKTVRSMLFLLPITIVSECVRLSAGYIYAGATHPQARGNGYYRRLLAAVEEFERRNGLQALLLRPATMPLWDSYRRMGFSIPLFSNASACALGTKSPLTASGYIECRQRCLARDGWSFVDWDDRTVSYAMTWCDTYQTEMGFVLVSRETDAVLECGPCEEHAAIQAALLKPLGDKDVVPSPIWFGYGLE